MGFCHRTMLTAGTIGLGMILCSCEPPVHSAADDEREPHYILGQNRVNAMDYQGAVEAFEASLEANPHSAAAHFQLAVLYDERESNPAAAIYHYEQFLRFDPKASNAEVITQRVYTCKQQLAADVLPLPSSSAALQQLQQLADKNRQLQEQLDKWQAYYQATNSPTPAANPVPQPVSVVTPSSPTVVAPGPAPSKPRTHTIVPRETLASIARKYGVSLNALVAANPSLNPKKLRVGQVINLPPP